MELFYRDGRALDARKAAMVRETSRADTFTITEGHPCSRCGGQGGSEAWKFTGYTCYQCGGHNSMGFHVRTVKLYTAERLAALQAAADKKAAKAAAAARRKADKARLEFIAWAKPNGKAVGRIILAGRSASEGFMADMASNLMHKRILTERQFAAAVKVLDDREARQVRDGSSEHVGHLGDRIDFDGNVEFTLVKDGYYGATTIVRFRDEAGNVLTWFASGVHGYEKDAPVHVRGTVKKHEEFRGVKATVLSRCKVTPREIP